MMDRETFEAALRADGYDEVLNRRTEASQVEAGQIPPEHAHDFDVRILILEGEFVLVRSGEPRRYGPGEVFEVPAGVPHTERFGSSGAAYVAGRRHKTAQHGTA
jgi:quercetin dioxygenase-like cupin family protein